MWDWLKKTWNYWRGGEKSATSQQPHAAPPFTPPPNTLPLKGNIWMLDPQTHIATRMVAVADPSDKLHGFKLVSTGERAFIPQSQTHLENRSVPDTAKVARDREKLAADIRKFRADLSHNENGKNNNAIYADRVQIEKDKRQLMADLHPAPSPSYVLNPMPAPGTLVHGVPVFQRREGHLVAAIDAGHGVERYTASPNQPITPKTGIAYDPGSKSVGSLRAGAPVTEDIINLHFSQDAAVAFARRGWDTIITRSSNEPRFAGRGFGHRIDVANQADVNISLHADQRLGDPNKKPRNEAERRELLATRERLAVQAKAEALDGDLSKLSTHEKAVLKTIDEKAGVRVYIDKRVGLDDHSLAFGKYLDTAHSKNDLIQDGYVRRPGYLMIHGEKIRRPGTLSLLLEPGAIDIAKDEAHLRSRDYRQAFAERLVEKTATFHSQCLPALRSGHTQPAQCTTPYHDPTEPAPKATPPVTEKPSPVQAKPLHPTHPPTADKPEHTGKPVHPVPPQHPVKPKPTVLHPAHDESKDSPVKKKPPKHEAVRPETHPPKRAARVSDLAEMMQPYSKKADAAKDHHGDHPVPTLHGKKPPVAGIRKH